jgi:glycine/D-amino acid oxidase-like deaminating enzyme
VLGWPGGHRVTALGLASPDVIVVGGGIVGTSTAAFLAGAGVRVLLVEREALASGASGANSGVVQHPFDPVMAGLYRSSLDLYRELAATSNSFAIGKQPVGMLYVTGDEATARRQAALIDGPFPELRAEVLGGAALQAVEPAVAPGTWACRVPIGFPVAPGSGTYAFASLAEARGVTIRAGRAAALEVDGDRVVGVRVDGRVVAAGAVMAAAGPWTPALLDPSGSWAPISPRWGVVVEAEVPGAPRHVLEEAGIEAVLDSGSGASGTPAVGDGDAGVADDGLEFSFVPQAGAGSVGSTFLPAEPDPQAWVERILVHATRFVPAIGDAPIRGVRCCPRPQADDGRPLVGAVPWLRGAFVCAGHGPWGISTGPGSARLVADLVLGRHPPIPVELDPARFGAPRG